MKCHITTVFPFHRAPFKRLPLVKNTVFTGEVVFLDVIIRCAVKGPVMSVMLCLVGLLRVTARITCSRLPTSGNWGCWWSSNRAKRWPWWRAKWANWSMTKRQVMEQSFRRSVDHISDVYAVFLFSVFFLLHINALVFIFSLLSDFQESWPMPSLLWPRKVISGL